MIAQSIRNAACRETGQPRSFPLRGRGAADVEAEVTALDGLSRHDLLIVWHRLFQGEPQSRLSRDMITREIAYRMQERVHGGLAPTTRRRLRALIAEIETRGADALDDPGVAVKPGARLLREWGGRTHTVLVLDDGFDYDGERFRSLSTIATRITGAHWSGPRFFGTKKQMTAKSRDA